MVDLLHCVGGPLDGARGPWTARATVRHEPRRARGEHCRRRVAYDTCALARWPLPNGDEELRRHCVADELARIA